jgi:hypothetical protein
VIATLFWKVTLMIQAEKEEEEEAEAEFCIINKKFCH